MSIKLLVVEDHPVVRLGLQMLLSSQPDIEIIAEANTAAKGVKLANNLLPDVVLMDIGLPDGSGINASAEIKSRHPEMAIVALTIHEDKEYIEKMRSVGASGYVTKRAAPDELLTAIQEAAHGQIHLHPTEIA
jgi:two-component system response regulator NreC